MTPLSHNQFAETSIEQQGQPLFKYLDVTGAKAMLKNSNLQFTNAMRLNDPFDCHPGLWVDFSNPYGHTNEYLENVERDGYDNYSEFRRNTFVCSLSKVYNSILMWSYYNTTDALFCKSHRVISSECDPISCMVRTGSIARREIYLIINTVDPSSPEVGFRHFGNKSVRLCRDDIRSNFKSKNENISVIDLLCDDYK